MTRGPAPLALASSVLLGLCLLLTLPAHAQFNALCGTVVDSEGDPLSGVTVTLTGLPASQMAVTGANGSFSFAGIPDGRYGLRAELPGFAAWEGSCNAANDRSKKIEIVLSALSWSDEAISSEAQEWSQEERKQFLMEAAAIGSAEESWDPPPWDAPPPPPPSPPVAAAPATAPPPPVVTAPPPPPAGLPLDGRNYVQLNVFYSTDRLPTGSKLPAMHYGKGRSRGGELHFGTCRVTIPRGHRMGEIEQPAIWKLEFRPDPAKHMVLQGIDPLSRTAFFKRMSKTLENTRKREILVFVHGFNVPFADAVLRTAQMAYDLNLDGAPVLYSWPSQASLIGYKADENNAEWTIPHLEAFLASLSSESGARSIYLIAHSMGNRPLTRALKDIAAKLGNGARPPFQEIILTAPDIDAGVFADLATEFRKAGERVTLYASSNDRALIVSKKFNSYPRAGDAGPSIVVIPGIDTVDASALETGFLGHSYYGDNCSVLADISRLLRERVPPLQRGLARKEKDGRPYWVVHNEDRCPVSP